MQAERTLLSWRRTCLALVVGGVGAARYSLAGNASFGLFAAAVAIALAGCGWVAANRRQVHFRRSLARRDEAAVDGDDGDLYSPGTVVGMTAAAAGSLALSAITLTLASAFAEC